jgi:hypothetical protein
MALVRPTPRRTGQFSQVNHEEVHYVTHNGAFNNNQRNARCAYRNNRNPNNSNRNRGFRVCVAHSSTQRRGAPEMSSGYGWPTEALRDGLIAPWPSRASCDAGRANIEKARLLGVCLEPGHPASLKRWAFEKAVWRATHVRPGTRSATV